MFWSEGRSAGMTLGVRECGGGSYGRVAGVSPAGWRLLGQSAAPDLDLALAFTLFHEPDYCNPNLPLSLP